MSDFTPPPLIQVRTARIEDYEAVRKLELRYGLESLSLEDFKYLWDANPHTSDLPMGWILETERKEVVGYLGNVTLLYELGERKIKAAATRAWVVDQRYRKYSILLLQNFLRQKADLLLNTTANREAQKILDSFRIPRVPSPDYDVSLVRITHPPGFARSLALMKDWPSLAALPLAALFAVTGLFPRPAACDAKSDEDNFKTLTSFDDRFDPFWEKLKSQNPSRLLASRDLRTLRWHFKPALSADKLWILVLFQGAEIQSYALFLRQDNPRFGLTRVRLVDFQSILESAESLSDLRALVTVAERKCKAEKIQMLEAVGFPGPIRNALQKMGFRRRRLPAWMFFYKTTDPELTQALKNPRAWFACSYDGDASL